MTNMLNQSEEPLKRSFKQTIKSQLFDFSTKTTSHGLPRIVEAEMLYQKILWTICLLASIALCSFMIVKTVSEYLQYDVITSIRIMSQEELTFPQVSVCVYDTTVSSATEEDFVILDCTFRYIDCNSLSIYKFVETPNGECFYFNSISNNSNSSLLSMSRAGDGLDLVFFVRPLQTSLSNETSKKSITPKGNVKKNLSQFASGYYNDYYTGIEIVIGDQHFFPLRELGVALSNGNLAKIGMSKTHTVMMESPYSECYNTDKIDTLLSREMNKLGLDYNRANCLLLCEQKVIIERIHCYDSRLPPILGATKPCETSDEIDALLSINYNIADCFDLCPYECESVSFDLSISYTQFPSQLYYQNTLKENEDLVDIFRVNSTDEITYELFSSQVLALFIYFNKIATTEISETPSVSIASLLANIGGTLGLFIGVSLLSFVEFVDLTINIAIILHRFTLRKVTNF